jgi:membrane associated rhomboid family serine protease
MTNSLESSSSSKPQAEVGEPAGWFRVGIVAAASALAGGLLAAWWYRKTLKKLRQAEEDAQNPHFGIPEEDSADEA